MNFQLYFMPLALFWIANSLLLTIQFPVTLILEEFDSEVAFCHSSDSEVCVTQGVVGESPLCLSIRSSSFSFDRC